MILSPLSDADRYTALHPLFARAFEFLRTTDLNALQMGKHPVLGDEIFIIVDHRTGRSRAEAKLECHRRYIDIQLVLEGLEEMGWRPVAECSQPATEYDETRDLRFFDDAPSNWLRTPAGSFCVFFPQDAHAPLVSGDMIRKVVMKIRA
ncbi:MAG: YhcH/YjgK/YiaL family protein [Betaproteobacteria bacterium]|nr:YhcH/YjgK/YiaL family protein [Betaproteobacteria bacterium]